MHFPKPFGDIMKIRVNDNYSILTGRCLEFDVQFDFNSHHSPVVRLILVEHWSINLVSLR